MKGTFTILLTIIFMSAAFGQTNYVKYSINVTLDTEDAVLSGSESLTYVNRTAGKPLNVLRIHLYQNAFRGPETEMARIYASTNNWTIHDLEEDEKGWMEVENLRVNGQQAGSRVDDTILEIELPEPMASGDTVTVELDFKWKISKPIERSGHKGENYAMAQWYPQIARYETGYGWHDHQYELRGEFCTDFGDFKVEITLPENYWVGATGSLIDSTASNTPPTLEEYEESKEEKNDEEDEENPDKTLTFEARNVRDFAWVASPNYIMTNSEWDGIKVRNLFFKNHVDKWKDAAQWGAQIIEFFSDEFGRYPYDNFTICEAYLGFGGAMEYPQLIMNGPNTSMIWTRIGEMVTAHEIGHNWFPMIMGTNEFDEPWLDEGFATYAETVYMESRYGSSNNLFNLPGWMPFNADVSMRSFHEILYSAAVQMKVEEPILESADQRDEQLGLQVANYSKPGWVLFMLGYEVGDSVLKEIVRTYFSEWQYRHPHTEDFIEVAERVSGEDLGWFFDQWLTTTETCDYAIGGMNRSQGSGNHVTEVTLLRKGGIIMSVEVEVLFEDGTRERKRVDGSPLSQIVRFSSYSKARSVRVDPDERLLEIDRTNNHSGRPPKSFHPLLSTVAPNEYTFMYSPSLWHHVKDGYRLGLWFNGMYNGYNMFVPSDGRNQLTFGASYGLEEKSFNYSIEYADHLDIGRLGRWYAGAREKEGRREFFTGATWWSWDNMTTWKHRHRFSASLSRYDVFDESYGYSFNWQKGATNSIALRWELRSRGHGWKNRFSVDTKKSVKFDSADFDFSKAVITNVFERKRFSFLLKSLRFRTYAGFVLQGTEPRFEKIDISGASPVVANRSFFLNEGGPLREIKSDDIRRYQVPGGGNLRGYWDRFISTERILAANVDVNLPFNLFLFYDIGMLGETIAPLCNEDFSDKTLSNAGLGVKFSPISIAFPLWLSDPIPGEDSFKFRWNFNISGGFSFGLY